MLKFLFTSILIVSSLNANWNDKATQLWDKTKNSLSGEQITKEDKAVLLKKEHFEDIWGDVIKKLEDSLALVNKREKAPKDKSFYEVTTQIKSDFNNDLNEVLDDMIKLLLNDKFVSYREDINEIHENISDAKKDILTYREKKITAPVESMVSTTKEGYNKKIQNKKIEILEYEKELIVVKKAMKVNFSSVGIELKEEQLDVLLARVDGNDIIDMMLVMDVLKQVTNQLMKLMNESGEELIHAKKYYGMNMVLYELIVYIQENYINKVSDVFIPKVNKIIADSSSLMKKSKAEINNERDAKRKSIYSKNIKAQELTLKTAKLYIKNLKAQENNIKKALKISRKNLVLSKNTYYTVELSSQLYSLISNSQNMFNEIMSLQVPQIVPFENSQIKQKYEELTQMIKSK
jgi:hypothetical protein